MFRYVALIWNHADPAQSMAAQLFTIRLRDHSDKWQTVLDANGFRVFCTGVRQGSSEVYRLRPPVGVVLGTLFERVDTTDAVVVPRKAVLGLNESKQVINSNGRTLTTAFWGRYVAFLYNERTEQKLVIRGPAGHLPCFKTQHRDVTVYFSLLDDCMFLDDMRFSLNWKYIGRHMLVPRHSELTGLNEVTEVLAGECIVHDAHGISKQIYWDRLGISASNVIENPVRAAITVRNTAISCIRAWAECYDRILLSLSGGLDSAIVAGCLAKVPLQEKVTCVNYYSSGVGGDEREFARDVARHTGLRLVERQRTATVEFRTLFSSIPRTPRPTGYAFRAAQSQVEDPLIRQIGVNAVFTGAGGDELFHRDGAEYVSTDYLYLHGFDRSFLRLAIAAAYAQHATVWSVLNRALYDRFIAHPWSPLKDAWRYYHLLSDDLRESLKNDSWLERSTDEAPPGKLMQAFLLSSDYDFFNHLGKHTDPEQVAPLMSEPMIELCLRIPTYLHCSNGLDRAVARQAFIREVPERILKRESKGMVEEHFHEMIARNIHYAREILADSLLVKKGFIDRHRTNEALSGRPSDAISGISEILYIVELEAWLRQWSYSGALSAV